MKKKKKMEKKNNYMALNENNSNEASIAGAAMALQIPLPMDTCLLTVACRIIVKLLNVVQTATTAVASCWTH